MGITIVAVHFPRNRPRDFHKLGGKVGGALGERPGQRKGVEKFVALRRRRRPWWREGW